MKIRPVMTFAALLLSLCMLSACGTSTSFNVQEIAYEPRQSVQAHTPANKKLPVGDQSRTFGYQYDEATLSGETWEVFQAVDGTTAKYCKQNASFSVTAGNNDIAIADASKSLAGKGDFLAHVESLIHLLAPDADLSAYEYACTTSYLKLIGPGQEKGWVSETANEFYRPQSEEEKIDSYLFTYTQVVNGLATENGISVETDGKGNLLAFRYDCHEADWTFSITEKELEKAVDSFIKDYGKQISSRADEVEILEKHLAIVWGEVQLCVTVEAHYPQSQGWFASKPELYTFTLYLSPKPST